MFLKEKDMVVFPVSGQWLKCTNPEVIGTKQSVWKSKRSAPPMSVPHIDSRIDGQKALLVRSRIFYHFLKNGSCDLPLSIKPDNIIR
jgi:malate dehydrogenase (quinone)